MGGRRRRVIIVRGCEPSFDVRVGKIADSLAALGCEVLVLGWDRSGSAPRHEQTRFGSVQRVRIRAGSGSGIRLLPKLLGFWLRVGVILTRERFDAVHACDFDALFPCLVVARIKRKRLVYDMFDFYAEGPNVPSPLRWLVRKLDRVGMRLADHLVVVDPVRLVYLPESCRKRARVIYNTPPDRLEWTRTADVPRIPRRQPGVFRVVYSGSLLPGRFILEMATAIGGLSRCEMVIAGFGPDWFRRQLAHHVESLGNVRYLGSLSSFEESIYLESTADMLFALYDTSIPNNRTMSANKLFEAFMLAKPIVVNRGTSMEDKVEQAGAGLVVDPGTLAELREATTRLQNDPGLALELGRAGRVAYDKHFRWSAMEGVLAEVYDGIAGTRN